ncbi:hypothetical protein SAMN05660916_02406 [Arthrobacter sp. 31Cvi3.1E]|nr:hypothetical protein SAMN05660916_02406 [Arthrobacter sp. 31Cvi3.1E]
MLIEPRALRGERMPCSRDDFNSHPITEQRTIHVRNHDSVTCGLQAKDGNTAPK